MAQLVAHLLCKQGVRGSSPLGSTIQTSSDEDTRDDQFDEATSGRSARAGVVVSGAQGRPGGKNVATARHLWVVAVAVVAVAICFGLLRSAQGASTGAALSAGLSVVVVTGSGLAVNQSAARRRARRRSTS